MYIRSKPEEKGYQGRLKAIWDHNKKEFKHFTGKHLAEQVRNIKKKNLLSEVDRQLIKLQHRITPQEPATPTVTIKQEETEQETNNHQEEVEDRREDESTNNIELKEELTKIWRKNFEKYIKMDINQREFSTKIKPPPTQEMLDILDLIVSEEIVTIEKSHPIDLWTINVIHYATAITLLEKENKLREIKTRISKKEKQGWQIRMENRIVALRRKISYVNVLMECYKNQKYTRHQREIRRRIEKQYGGITKSKLELISTQLKQELKVESHKLKNRKTVQERRYINRMFKEAPKKVYRSIKGGNAGPVKDTPTTYGVQEFWGTLWGTSVEHNPDPPWITTLRD